VSGLAARVKERNGQWLKRELEGSSVIDSAWRYQVELFVRSRARPSLKAGFRGQSDVIVHSFEENQDIVFPWEPAS